MMGLVFSESEVLVLWWFTWFVCGTACCNTVSFSNLSVGLLRRDYTKKTDECNVLISKDDQPAAFSNFITELMIWSPFHLNSALNSF